MNILEIHEVKKYFRLRKSVIKALDGVDISIEEGITTSLVGESGCGKTTLAKTVLGFYKPDEGKIVFRGEDITDIAKKRKIVTRSIQIVFQNPFLSFDPRYTVFTTLYEAMVAQGRDDKRFFHQIIKDTLKSVGLGDECIFRYPHQLSGGQLQRVSIARALLCAPEVIILDEPTSNLDVSTTVKIIELFSLLQKEKRLTYLFISHNLKLVRNISHTVYVMYRGRIVESGHKDLVYNNPLHPYTKLLMEASEYKLKGSYEIRDEREGCVFSSRCPIRGKKCNISPEKVEKEKGHFVYCHYV